jgi:hypothetical protein
LIRERWAQLTNEALLAAGIDERVDHRSYIAQGVNRNPVVSMPPKVVYSERKYGRSAAGDEIRARHRERVEARLKGKEELARVVRKQKEESDSGRRWRIKSKQNSRGRFVTPHSREMNGFSCGGRNTKPTRT